VLHYGLEYLLVSNRVENRLRLEFSHSLPLRVNAPQLHRIGRQFGHLLPAPLSPHVLAPAPLSTRHDDAKYDPQASLHAQSHASHCCIDNFAALFSKGKLMATSLWHRRIAPVHLILVVALALACSAPATHSTATELADQAGSLRMAPKDAAYYSASLRLKEQYDAFRKSNAYDKLMQIPAVQFVVGQIQTSWQLGVLPGMKEVREYVESPEGKESVAILKEMVADEVFLYGGNEITEWLQLVMQASTIQRQAREEAAESDEEMDDVAMKKLLDIFEEREGDFNVPTMVLGFRVKDTDRAKEHLDVVQAHLRTLLDDKQPELAAHLQREQIADHEFLTLQLEGSMIPWDKFREDVDADDMEAYERLQNIVSKKTAVVALGVVDEYILLSIGESNDHLEKIGEGPFLAEHDAIKRLEPHADERVVSITYMSEEVAKNLSSPQKQFKDMAAGIDEALEGEGVSEEHRSQIADDIRELSESKYIPQPGETSAIAFLTDRGYEGFQYQTGTQPMLNSDKPLSILERVGGNPLAFIASRSNDTVKDYDAAVAWLKRTARHIEDIAQTKAKPEDWDKYLEHREQAIELLRRLNRATREHIYPAFASNEGALVVDASAESQQWSKRMPKSPEALPMLELGVVASVSDAEQLRKGVKEYCAVFRDAIELAREIEPEKVPKFTIPDPEKRETDGDAKLFVFSLPEDWRLDEQISPTAGMTDSAAVLSTMPATAERLLNASKLEIDTSIDLDRPAAAIVHVKIGAFVAKLRPWIDYGMAVALGNLKNEVPEGDGDEESDAENGSEEDAANEDEDEEDEPSQPSPLAFQLGFVMPQVYQFMDVAAVFQSVTSITYQEDGVWVTHSETHIKDLED
jgi:hypothetical protein